jgi:2-polyprenyl-6-methoxyphenol hydroxylase-like FAD-dependent oxidoreductase
VTANAKGASDHDAVIVGASLAGCTAAILLGRAGARVALVEKQPDRDAFKRICSHLIQASGVPTLERLGLLEEIEAAGGIRPRMRVWTRWGWIEAPPGRGGEGVNLRRQLLDPMIRAAAAATPGVEFLPGRTATRLLREGSEVAGVAVRERDGSETELRAPLTVGADGRESTIAGLAGVRTKTRPHGRFVYGAYFEGAGNPSASTVWLLDPQFVAAFPTDGGLCLYVAMPTKERLPEFKPDPAAALVEALAATPDPLPIRELSQVGEVLGKIEMPNKVRVPVAPGLALVGDAGLTTDPLSGVGCGWALQSGEYLADSVAPALLGDVPLERALATYRRKRRPLVRHAYFINDLATGRRLNPGERLLFAGGARDEEVATQIDRLGMRLIEPQAIAAAVPRAIAANARHALGRGRAAATVARQPPGG